MVDSPKRHKSLKGHAGGPGAARSCSRQYCASMCFAMVFSWMFEAPSYIVPSTQGIVRTGLTVRRGHEKELHECYLCICCKTVTSNVTPCPLNVLSDRVTLPERWQLPIWKLNSDFRLSIKQGKTFIQELPMQKQGSPFRTRRLPTPRCLHLPTREQSTRALWQVGT